MGRTAPRLRILRGNPSGKPIRPEPQPEILITPEHPPVYLTALAATEWERVVKQLHKLRMLTALDLPTLAAYCQAYAVWVEAQYLLKAAAAVDHVNNGLLVPARSRDSKGFVVNPLLAVIRESAREMFRYASEFGFTPVARTRIAAADDQQPASKFAGLIAS